MIRTYSELSKLKTFEERFRYLKLDGVIGDATFGSRRFFNQAFYHSPEWIRIRREVILRDNGCDLGIEGFDLRSQNILIHHMNPVTMEDVRDFSSFLMDPEYLICVSHRTHNAIHYGDETLLVTNPVVRKAGDTCPWR